ncbi:MAG: hypothetical protein KDA28_03215, partial [Phycisphaerales bacterium]|nr:hypothetical protein [Phycisphaerales bacterium]
AIAPIDGPSIRVDLDTSTLVEWAPDAPVRHDLTVVAEDGAGDRTYRSDTWTSTFGLRHVTTGGARNGSILVNGRPIQIRGALHWGHEPAHIAPSPTEDEIRAEFHGLRERGFNLVCVCMWYPPEHFYRIASECGMMLWQIHPVWKSDMSDDLVEEYRRQYEDFFRRDARHEAVVLVSGACEHERFHPDLASWWWARSRERLPDVLRQTQTAFFEWVDPAQNDLLDEHTYDSCGRWPFYLDDVQAHLDTFDARPFVLGESIVFNSWIHPDDFEGHEDAWWRPHGLAEAAALERTWTTRHALDLDRFRADADRQNLLARKFQYELFRTRAHHAGVVMNAVRDVAQCRCGMKDELDRWRFEPHHFDGWFADVVLVLRTPGDMRGVVGGATTWHVVVSNGGATDLDATLTLDVGGTRHQAPVRAPAGTCVTVPFALELASADEPTPLDVHANVAGARNAWRLWTLPDLGMPPDATRAAPCDHWSALEPEFEERKYSSGWGLPISSWSATNPDPERLCPEVRVGVESPSCLVTPVLDDEARRSLDAGIPLLHLASKAKDAFATRFFQPFEQVPLVLEHGPFAPGDASWIVDLLHTDLMRGMTRCMKPSFEIMPLVRLVLVHDKVAPVEVDLLGAVRIDGTPVVLSTIDHASVGGAHVLRRVAHWLSSGAPGLAIDATADDLFSATNGRQAT